MAKRAQVLLVFATVLGLNPMTVELILRYLAKAGLVPQGLPGRRSAHYTAEHIKNLILALAAYQPSDAVTAVQTLNDLSCRTNDLSNRIASDESAVVKKGTLFGDWLVQQIEARVVRVEADYIDLTPMKEAYRVRREVRMALNPPSASNWQPNDPDDVKASSDWYYVDFFYQEEGKALEVPRPVLSRQTAFTVELLIAAGTLLADTLAAQAATSIPDPAPGSAGEGNATPDTTKASGTGIHEGLRSGLPAPKAQTAPVDTAQSATGKARKQRFREAVTPRVQVRHQLEPTRNKNHGPHWSHPAPA